MSKPFLLYQAPVATRSGYGDHARDLLKSFKDLNYYDIKNIYLLKFIIYLNFYLTCFCFIILLFFIL